MDCFVVASLLPRNGETSSYSVGIIDCHANASAFARNDEKSVHNAKSTRNDERLTHPQTPSAREGALEKANSAVCHTERSEVSKNANANVQNPLDISVSTKPQYDKASGHNVISPSLAEGARGWVNTTSALQAKSATANTKDTHPQTPSAREGVLRSFPTSQSICHTERSEVSQAESNKDISLSLNMTTKNERHTTPSKSKRLALSLAAAGIIAGIGIDIAAAACGGREDWSQGMPTQTA